MTTSSPVRIVGCNEPGPSDPVRIVNWQDVAQLDSFESTDTFFRELSENIVNDEITLTKTEATVLGVRQVTLGYSAHQTNIGGVWYNVPAGTILLNSGHVVNPTTYYVYCHIVAGVCTVTVSITNPETDPAVNYEYAWVAIVRLKSVGGVATIYYWRTAYTPNKLFLHYIGEYDYYTRPTWIQGGGLTINATTGVVDMADLDYRRMRFDREEAAITAGTILFEDESAAVANLELITTYSDGSTITAGKYHKLLFGVIVGDNKTNPFIVVRQAKPSVEYATLAEATNDAENKAGTSFPFTYRGGVFHLAYIIMLKGDASDLTTIDIRPTGAGGGSGGGGSPVTDHDALTNLGTTSHDKYLLQDGTRAVTGDMAVDPGKKIDGVDISAHAADANAHHNAVTLNADADTLLGLSTQQITLDTQSANRVLAGPTSGAAAVPTMRALVPADFPTTGELGVVLANGVNNNINIGTALLIRITGPTASFSVDGFTGGYAGRVLYVYNAAAQNMTANNEAGTSTAANRILTLGGAAVTNGIGIMTFVYSAIDSRWILDGVRS